MSGQRDLQRGAVTRPRQGLGLLGALGAIALVALLSTAVGAPAQQPAVVSSAAGPAMVADKVLGDEIVGMRTRTSKTFPGQDGRYVTRLFGKSVHFKDAAGQWREIDNVIVQGVVGLV